MIPAQPPATAHFKQESGGGTTQPESKIVNSRDGLWSYDVSGCGYTVHVTHRPSGRTTSVGGGITAARRMAKSGELLALLAPVVDRVEAAMRQFDTGILVEELARHLEVDEAEVRDALQTLYAAGLVREHDGGPIVNYRSVWIWAPQAVSA